MAISRHVDLEVVRQRVRQGAHHDLAQRSGRARRPRLRRRRCPRAARSTGASTSTVRSTCWKSTCSTLPRTGWSCQSFRSTGRARTPSIVRSMTPVRPSWQGSAQLAVGQRERQRRAARLVDDAGHEAPAPEPARGSVAELGALLRVEGDVCHRVPNSSSGPTRESTGSLSAPAHSRTGNRLRSGERSGRRRMDDEVRRRRRPPGRGARGEPGRDVRAPGGPPAAEGADFVLVAQNARGA